MAKYKGFEVDLDGTLKTPSGEAYQQAGQKGDETIGSLVCQVLCGTHQGDDQLDVKTKLRRAALGERALKGGVQEFSVEDLAMIRQYVGRACQPYVVLQVYRATGGEDAA